ncbi:MAG TPA: hypothetical protein VGP46_09830 [Acidimicrobiales bacterium]|nr:hypothetical protein [Acidimicrobiales bacterium]
MGVTKVDLPGGAWVELRDPMDATERQRRPLREAFMEMGRAQRGPSTPAGSDAVTTPLPPQLGGGQPVNEVPVAETLDAIDDFTHKAVAFFITAWSFEFPCTPESLYDIPVPIYNAIDEAALPMIQEMIPQLKPAKPALGEVPTTP